MSIWKSMLGQVPQRPQLKERTRGAGATGAAARAALTVQGQCGGNWLPLFVKKRISDLAALTNKLLLLTGPHIYKYILWPRSFHGSFTHYTGYVDSVLLSSWNSLDGYNPYNPSIWTDISLLNSFCSFLTHLNFCGRLAQSCSGRLALQ
jgi:hypothetical protein